MGRQMGKHGGAQVQNTQKADKYRQHRGQGHSATVANGVVRGIATGNRLILLRKKYTFLKKNATLVHCHSRSIFEHPRAGGHLERLCQQRGTCVAQRHVRAV